MVNGGLIDDGQVLLMNVLIVTSEWALTRISQVYDSIDDQP